MQQFGLWRLVRYASFSESFSCRLFHLNELLLLVMCFSRRCFLNNHYSYCKRERKWLNILNQLPRLGLVY
jgi:hypothetical protein